MSKCYCTTLLTFVNIKNVMVKVASDNRINLNNYYKLNSFSAVR